MVLIGMMGVGKSTVGRHLAVALRKDFFDSDKEIERNSGASISWIFDVEGEAGFRKRESEAIANICLGCLLYTSPSPRDQRGSGMRASG